MIRRIKRVILRYLEAGKIKLEAGNIKKVKASKYLGLAQLS